MKKQEQTNVSPIGDIPATMQALVASDQGFEHVRVREVPVPQIGPGQLLARVDAAGVCTSNLKLLAQGQDHTFINGWDLCQWPIILGDEGAITLVKVGENLRDRFRIGQRFVIQPAVNVAPILHRERYRDQAAGMNKCAVGYTLPGHLAQYMLIQEEVIQAECLLPIPTDEMPLFEAAMAEPISCCVSAQERHYHLLKQGPHAARHPHLGLLPGGVTVVSGAGVMGRMHAELALRFGPRVLIVVDYLQARLDKTQGCIAQKARKIDCQLICVSPDHLATVLQDKSPHHGVDDFILAVGVREAQQHALGLLAYGGVANLFGGLPKGQHILNLDALAVHYHEIKVVGSSGGDPSDIAATLDAIVARHILPGNYVAAIGSLDNAVEVLKMIRDQSLDGRAILYPHIPAMPLRAVDGWNGAREKALLAERQRGPA
jgi:threonine dehydrogenase-like Zn-dependent dehydrogenase